MAYENNTQNNSNEKDMRTKGLQFYNKSVNGSTCVLGYINGYISIKICPLLSEDKRVGKKMYNYDQYMMTALDPAKAQTLVMGLDEQMEQCSEYISSGIPIKSGFIEICNGKHLNMVEETERYLEENMYICLFGTVDSEGVPSQMLIYEFNSYDVYKGYNHKKGEIDKTQFTKGEFLMFYKSLVEFVKASTNASVHSIRNVQKYQVEKAKSEREAIMSKLGISIEKAYSGSTTTFFKGNNNSTGGFDNSNVDHETINQDMERFSLDN